MTAEKNETLADIVAKWMPHFKKYADPHVESAGFDMAGDAVSALGEISEAWKRESVTNCHWLGNAAKLREALAALLAWCEAHAGACAIRVAPVPDDEAAVWAERDRAMEIARAALAAPARNCDRFATAEDAYKAFSSYCFNRPSEGKCVGCPIVGEGGKSNCFGAWLMAAAQEGGDDADA